MSQIATYVFLDLETTGIPQHELNKTRITELSMVAVNTAHLLRTRPGMTPRVQHKLSLCFNPRRMIDPGCTEVSGLCNDLLEHEACFDKDTFILISKFIERLLPPVCLIAQNGDNFDYPILKNHLVRLGVSLADNLLCADSFHAFYDILEAKTCTESEGKTQQSLCTEASNNTVTESPEMVLNEMRLKNETTPKKLMIQCTAPDTPKKVPEIQTKEACKALRKFPWSRGNRPKLSYKLSNVYERLLNRPAKNAHRAECDCMLLLESVGVVAKSFVEWVNDENNHKKFSEVKAMTLGVPLGQ